MIDKTERNRDYLFDNIKAILIFFVVLGHFIEIGLYKNELYKGIWYAIYSFHMPLFIFIVGYFYKNSKDISLKAVKNYLIPYIIFDILIYIFRLIVLEEEISFKLLNPQYAMWFMLAIFWYKLSYNGISKIRGIFIISILLSIFIGLDTSFTNVMAISRTVIFFPFFIAGNRFKKDYLIKQDNNIFRVVFIISMLALLIAIATICIKFNVPMDLLRASVPYKNLDINLYKAIIFRIIILLVGFSLIYLILNVAPRKKHIFTCIGQNTVVVYLVHIFFILYCMKNNLLDGTKNKTFIISVILTIFIVIILSLPIVRKGYDFIMNKIYKILNIDRNYNNNEINR